MLSVPVVAVRWSVRPNAPASGTHRLLRVPLKRGVGGRQDADSLRCVDVRNQVRRCTSGWGEDRDRSLQFQRRQQPIDTVRVRVMDLEFRKREPLVLQVGCRMNLGVPFDQCWRGAVQRNRTVSGDGDEPVERTPTHRFNSPERFGGSGNRGSHIGGAHDPGGQRRERPLTKVVEAEPARSGWRGDGRVGGDDLKEHGIAQAQQEIVSCHAWVLAANLRRNTEGLQDEGRTCIQREGSHRDVIEKRARHLVPQRVWREIRPKRLLASTAASIGQ